jgi:hypothetical protein
VKTKELVGALRQMQTLVAECLTGLGAGDSKRMAKSPKSTTRTEGSKKVLPGHILRVRAEGYFSQPRTAREVHDKLAPTYACEINRVAMALLRLNDRKQLRKASKVVNKRKQVAYVW